MSTIRVFYGNGFGKTSAAMGYSIRAAGNSKEVIIVQFMKGSNNHDYMTIERLEPEIKLLNFERYETSYEELTPEQQGEQKANILNGFNYARKVIQTGGCDVLILDESLGLIDNHIVDSSAIVELLNLADQSEMEIVLTGRILPEDIKAKADIVTRIEAEK